MNEFKRFEDRLTGLIESLSPSGRRRLSAELAKRLRQSQQRRVMAQKAPDGTPYAPRQQQSARKKTGRVKRKMFAKLITSRFLHSGVLHQSGYWSGRYLHGNAGQSVRL